MVFGNESLKVHISKGLAGFTALGAALWTMNETLIPSIFLLPLSLYLLRGCPLCWTIGLFETIAMRYFKASGRSAGGSKRIST